MIDRMEDMTREDIQQLLTENERLKKENEELKVSLSFSSVETINGVEDPAELRNDTVFRNLNQRLDLLGQSNTQLKTALAGFEELEKGLSTLLPALEVQLRGWNSEINQLRRSIEQTENAYVGVVARLEEQVKDLRNSQEAEKQALEARHEAQLAHLTQQIDQLSQRLSQTEAPPASLPSSAGQQEANPFTSLSIYPEIS
jgi:chromosome segregation ATPase